MLRTHICIHACMLMRTIEQKKESSVYKFAAIASCVLRMSLTIGPLSQARMKKVFCFHTMRSIIVILPLILHLILFYYLNGRTFAK